MSGQAKAPRPAGAAKVVAVNGSPRLERGHTGQLLAAFVRGMEKAGAQVDTLCCSRLKLKPCNCGEMECWFKHPTVCKHKDDMVDVLPLVSEADTLVLATPVYVPLPSAFQDFLNRLSPLMEPEVTVRGGRSRARYREGVKIGQVVALSTGGWWELENFDSVLRIVRELAENASVRFAGALLRPHFDHMYRKGALTAAGEAVLEAGEQAGRELVEQGCFQQATLEAISRPLVSWEEHTRWFNDIGASVGR